MPKPWIFVTFLLLLSILRVNMLLSYNEAPEYIVAKPSPLRLYDTRQFRLFLRLLLIYNGSKESGIVGFSYPIFVNNFWSDVKLERIKIIEGNVISFTVETYDINILIDTRYKKVPNIPSYGFVHHMLLLNLRADHPRQEYIVDIVLKVRASRVDGSRLVLEKGGTIRDAIKELGEDYKTYTASTYYWDYDNPVVQKILSLIRKSIEKKYARRIDEIPIMMIARELINWISYNTYYMERFDYPYFRLKVSKLLNRTIEIEGRKKYYGVCRHIVDIFVALARGLGIPANRYEGLIFGEFNGRMIFYGFHAWAEIYVPKIGWIPAEVTITHPFERDLIDLGDLEYVYYIPMVHEYNNYKPPFLPLILPVFLSIRVSNITVEALPSEEVSWLPHTIYIPTLGRISLRDFILITIIALLLMDDIYLHRKTMRVRQSR